jgi:hypothetical protein
MGYYNECSMDDPNAEIISNEGWSVDDRPATQLPAGLRIARYDEPGWAYRTPTTTLWVTDAPPLTTDHPAITKRIGEYDPTTRQYPAYVSIDGEPEQLVGIRWSAGAADLCADEYIFQYYVDRHTPEAAARIALAFAPAQPVDDTPYCFFHPDATDHDTRHCPKLDEPGFGEPSYSVFN